MKRGLNGGGSPKGKVKPRPKKQRKLNHNNHNNETTQHPLGLKNCGNSCYFNSALQILFASKPVSNLLLNYDLISHHVIKTADSTARDQAKKKRIFLEKLQMCIHKASNSEISNNSNNSKSSNSSTSKSTGEYLSEESVHRVYGSTVVDISMTPPSFKHVS